MIPLRPDLADDLTSAITLAMSATRDKHKPSSVSITFKIKHNKNGTAIECLDRLKVTTPTGERTDEVWKGDERVTGAEAVEIAGQERATFEEHA